MTTEQKRKRVVLVAGILLVLLAAAMAGLWYLNRPASTTDEKTITIEVVGADGETVKTASITTSREFLGEALLDEGLVEGTKMEYGLYITHVNGIPADEAKQQWWCITKGGEQVMTSADTTPIADGDVFEITLTTGY